MRKVPSMNMIPKRLKSKAVEMRHFCENCRVPQPHKCQVMFADGAWQGRYRCMMCGYVSMGGGG